DREANAFVGIPRTGVQLRCAVPEAPQELHPACVVPHACRDQTAPGGGAAHLLDGGFRLGNEVQDEGRSDAAVASRAPWKVAGTADDETDPRITLLLLRVPDEGLRWVACRHG